MATIRVEIINNSKTVRVVDLTDYASYPNARGILVIQDPNGNYIVNNGDFDNPDITVGSPISAEFSLNLVAGAIPEGIYTVTYNVDYDLDDISDDTTDLTFTYDTSDLVTIAIEVESSLADATIQSTDISVYDGTVTLDSRTHSLTDPVDVVNSSSDKDTNTTIALVELRTGQYEAEITSSITIAVSSTYWIIDSINGTQTHNVWASDGITDLEPGIAILYDRYNTSLATDNGNETEALETIVSQVNMAYSLYQINRFSGDVDQAAIYLNDIVELLAAENITIIEPTSESIPITRIYPGYATAWYNDSGVPSDDLGRNGDYYYRTDTNQIYFKSSNTWGSPISTLGANTIIQFSADGSTGWTTTYANGLNYIRFSGNGGVDWTVASKFIDGYRYVAYASDAAGTDFISEDDPGFTFNPILEYRAEKKFDESHNGDLVAGDFVGLFTKYRDSGIIAYSSNPSVSIQTDKDGNNPVFPVTNPEIFVYDGDTDVTSSWTVAIDSTVDITASVINDNEIDITAIAADSGSITIGCSRSGYDDLNVMILVSKTKAGQAVIDSTSVDNSTIEFDVPTQKIRVKDGGITGVKLNSNVVDDDTLQLSGSELSIKDNGITSSKLNIAEISNINRTFTKLGDSNGTVQSDGTAAGQNGIAWMNVDRMAYSYTLNNTNYLACIDYAKDIDTWSVIGTPLSGIASDWAVYKIVNLGDDRICILQSGGSGVTSLEVYSFNGSVWASDGDIDFDSSDTDHPSVIGLSSSDKDNIFIIFRNQPGGTGDYNISLRKYLWGGSSFSQVGNDLIISSGIATSGLNSDYDIDNIDKNDLYLYFEDSNDSDVYKIKKHTFDGTDFVLEYTSVLDLDRSVRILALSNNEFLLYKYTNGTVYNYKYRNGAPYLLDKTYDSFANSSTMDMTKMLNGNIALAPYKGSTITYIEMLFRLKVNE